MSLDKAIKHGKERRRQYREGEAKLSCSACRNHGWCDHCQRQRTHNSRRRVEAVARTQDDGSQP